MTAILIDGKAIATTRQQALRQRIDVLVRRDLRPCLVSVSVGDDPAWAVYAKRQRSSCERIGIRYRADRLPADASHEQLAVHIEQLNNDAQVHGIIIQSPLPGDAQLESLQALLAPAKDVEGVGPANLGLVLAGRHQVAPCTALSAVALAQAALPDLRGVEAVIVGASVIVGKPVAELLVAQGATPTLCHIDTVDLAAHTRRADLLVVAVGKAGLITPDMVKPGAVVVDVGINRVQGDNGKSQLVGDVHPEVATVAGQLTPVPGGVGALTTTILMEATVAAAEGLDSTPPALAGHALVQALGDSGLQLSPALADQLAALLSRHLVTVSGGGVLRSPLVRRLEAGLVVMDGATGTRLQLGGVSTPVEQANIDWPEQVEAVHRSYVEAGAQFVTANTFRANRYACGDASTAIARIQAGIRLARRAAFGRALVLGSIGPLGPVLGAEIDQNTARTAFAEVAQAMADVGADGIMVETMLSTAEAVCAVQAIRSVCDLPVLVSRPFRGGDLADVDDFVDALQKEGVAALGVNCVSGLRSLQPVVERLCARATVPVLVRPNAGYPSACDQGPSYQLQPEYFVRMARAYAAAGARLIGGCCGTGPDHIAALAAVANEIPLGHTSPELIPAASTTMTPVSEPELVGRLQRSEFPVLALMPPGISDTAARTAACQLVRAGVQNIGLQDYAQSSRARVPFLRHLQDHCGAAGLVTLPSDGSLRQAQEQLLAAHLLGLRAVLIDAGVLAVGGDIKRSERLVQLVAALNQGRDLAGNRLVEATRFAIGLRLRADQLSAAGLLATAGAHFICLQPVYERTLFRKLMGEYDKSLPVIAEILVLGDAETADAVDNELPVLRVPGRLKQRLAADPDEDRRGVLRFLQHWRSRLAGVCLLLPDERTDAATAVLAEL